MFCSNCGVQATGNFCHGCGAKLNATPTLVPVATGPWEDEIRYDVLLKVPQVRETLAKLASQAQPGISAQDFLGLCESAFKPMGPISLTKAAPILQKIYGRWGVKTGKQRSEVIPGRPGEVLFCLLCELTQGGHEIKEVTQGDDGCVIQAVIPSSMFAMEGKLVLSVTRVAGGTRVEAATQILGQYFDWGVSQRLLNRLFRELPRQAA